MSRVHDVRAPELLAPAGGPDALRAAINNGVDAVYLGVGQLNARRGAENFTADVLQEACDFAHLHGSRVYLTANVVVLPQEMGPALETIDQAWSAGVDAVIVQDLGLIRCLRQTMPEVRLHASTQINTHNTLTARELARLGITRVTLARETSVREAAAIAADGVLEVETFVHGALCFCYSGQCLMSSLIGGRSGNRGLCAQPCRLAYELVDSTGTAAAVPGSHLLSPRDLCGIEMLPQLVSAGVAALKIEGRMKEPEYVALVTGVYRAALDRATADPDGFQVTEAEQAILAEAFNRGFSSAYLSGVRDNTMMSYTRPNNRGVPVGRVAHVSGQTATVLLDADLDAEDTIEFWTSRGRSTQRAGALSVRGNTVPHAPAGARADIVIERPVSSGDRVFRVANASLIEAARRTFAADAAADSIEVDIRVRVVVGEPLEVRVTDGVYAGLASGPVVEAARTKSVTAEEIMEHVGRLGGTPYRPRAWDIELEPGAGIGFSVLHRIRRDAIASHEAAVLGPWKGRQLAHPTVPAPSVTRRSRGATPDLVVWCLDPDVARSCLQAGAARAIVPAWALQGADGRADSRAARDVGASDTLGDGLVVEVPRVVHDREAASYLGAATAAGRAVVGNLGLVRQIAESGVFSEAHWGLNALNPWAVEALQDMGTGLVWLSPELSERQTAEIAAATAVPVGMAVYGRQEVMVTEHCVLMALGECRQNCPSCQRRGEAYELRDTKGYRFPVMTDPTGRSHIFNSVPLDLSNVLGQVIATGVSAVRLDFVSESADAARAVVQRFARVLGGAEDTPSTRRGASTSGHFFRGVR